MRLPSILEIPMMTTSINDSDDDFVVTGVVKGTMLDECQIKQEKGEVPAVQQGVSRKVSLVFRLS